MSQLLLFLLLSEILLLLGDVPITVILLLSEILLLLGDVPITVIFTIIRNIAFIRGCPNYCYFYYYQKYCFY